MLLEGLELGLGFDDLLCNGLSPALAGNKQESRETWIERCNTRNQPKPGEVADLFPLFNSGGEFLVAAFEAFKF